MSNIVFSIESHSLEQNGDGLDISLGLTPVKSNKK